MGMIIDTLKDWASGGQRTREEARSNAHRHRAERYGYIIDILSQMADQTNEDHTESDIQTLMKMIEEDKEWEERLADYYDGEMSLDELIEEFDK